MDAEPDRDGQHRSWHVVVGAPALKPTLHLDDELDPEIESLVAVFNAVSDIVTFSSCSGHERSVGYIGFSIKQSALPALLEVLNLVDHALRTQQITFDVSISWRAASVGSEILDAFPEWIGLMLYMGVAGVRSGDQRRPLYPLARSHFTVVADAFGKAFSIPRDELSARVDELY